MNWIIVPVRNNLHLTRRAIPTFRAQDIGNVRILVINNASTDGTAEWLNSQTDLFRLTNLPAKSVAASWNRGLDFVFDSRHESYALVVNNDVELRPDTYRYLVEDGGGFVTAVGSKDPGKIKISAVKFGGGGNGYDPPDPAKKRPHPDFSCYLIRSDTWRRVGRFDEGFKIAFCEDWDYHVRLHRAGITAEALELPFLHHASQTVKNATDVERDRILEQAAANRDYFQQKWGVRGGTPEYYALFGNEAPSSDNDDNEKENDHASV